MSVIETASAPACAAMRAAPRPHDRRLYVREGAGFIEAAPEDVFDIARELIAERFYPRALVLSDPDLVKLFFRLQLGPCTRQVFAAAYLNARRRLLGYVELSMGTVNQVEIYPRVAVREGLIRNATLVIFGRNASTIVAMGFTAGLAPVILKTLEGLSATRRVLINVGRSFNLTPSQQFWKILFPAALPTIFVGMRLGLIFALINIVGVEYLINFGGLGQLINELAERYDLAGTYASICFVILVSVLFFMTVEKAERWLTRAD